MILLALDTSTPFTSCALCDGERVLQESLHAPPEKAGDLLPAALAALCARQGLRLAEVRGIAVGLGPGSFTGLRVGLAAAKALSYALRVPIAGASSLLALARAAPRGETVCAAIEARKGELYVLTARDGAPLDTERVVRAAELRLPPGVALVGPGAQVNRAVLESPVLDEPRAPPAAGIARLALPRLAGAAFDAEACFALSPNYLQAPLAEVALAEGRVGGLPKA